MNNNIYYYKYKKYRAKYLSAIKHKENVIMRTQKDVNTAKYNEYPIRFHPLIY